MGGEGRGHRPGHRTQELQGPRPLVGEGQALEGGCSSKCLEIWRVVNTLKGTQCYWKEKHADQAWHSVQTLVLNRVWVPAHPQRC